MRRHRMWVLKRWRFALFLADCWWGITSSFPWCCVLSFAKGRYGYHTNHVMIREDPHRPALACVPCSRCESNPRQGWRLVRVVHRDGLAWDVDD